MQHRSNYSHTKAPLMVLKTGFSDASFLIIIHYDYGLALFENIVVVCQQLEDIIDHEGSEPPYHKYYIWYSGCCAIVICIITVDCNSWSNRCSFTMTNYCYPAWVNFWLLC